MPRATPAHPMSATITRTARITVVVAISAAKYGHPEGRRDAGAAPFGASFSCASAGSVSRASGRGPARFHGQAAALTPSATTNNLGSSSGYFACVTGPQKGELLISGGDGPADQRPDAAQGIPRQERRADDVSATARRVDVKPSASAASNLALLPCKFCGETRKMSREHAFPPVDAGAVPRLDRGGLAARVPGLRPPALTHTNAHVKQQRSSIARARSPVVRESDAGGAGRVRGPTPRHVPQACV
jgi:hypothetical protein